MSARPASSLRTFVLAAILALSACGNEAPTPVTGALRIELVLPAGRRIRWEGTR